MRSHWKIPKFDGESEEAQWWFDHRDELAEAFEEAAAAGTLQSGSAAILARKENPADS